MSPPRKAISLPARICTYMSAFAAVRVSRGSTTMVLALRCILASIAHLNPQGWFSAGFPPMINIMSVFFMSIHFFLIDPGPTEIYTLSLHDALPIYPGLHAHHRDGGESDRPVARSVRCRSGRDRSEEHTSELQSLRHLVCRLLL